MSSSTRCEFYGAEVTSLTALGSRFCDGCKEKYNEFLCDRCGQHVVHNKHFVFELQTTCSSCQMRDEIERLSPEHRETIVAYVRIGHRIRAIKEAHKYFPIFREAVDAVLILEEELKQQ